MRRDPFLGAVHLTVADLERSVAYYREVVGLRPLAHDSAGRRSHLGVDGRELLVLVEVAGAQQIPRRTGLFHVALLLPTRADLAAWLGRAARQRIELSGLSDHIVSEAVYLTDPDGHGVELYADRPQELWRDGDGQVQLSTLALDVESLLAAAEAPSTGRLPAGTTVGHVHLKVADVDAAVSFYTRQLGLDLTVRFGDDAAFFGAGGYHHRVGVNAWGSRGAAPPPPGAAALRYFTVVAPRSELIGRELTDPSGNRLRFVTG